MSNRQIAPSPSSAEAATKEKPTRGQASRLVKEAMASFSAGAPHLALHGHEIDQHADKVLARLGSLGRTSDAITAAEAIVSTVPRESWPTLFADCIVAEFRARRHEDRIKDAQLVQDRSAGAKKAIATLALFLRLPRYSAPVTDDPVREALDLLRSAVAMEQRLAGDQLKMLSRKKTAEAARAHGTGWIKESLVGLARAAENTEPRHIAVIATAALGMGDVTPDAARKASGPRARLDRL